MKILSIKGCNIASLEGEFSVDFESEPLASSGIFAISGPTGAGKSTLLDAMCLALFCETPRTVNATENNVKIIDASGEELSQDDSRSLLRRGTSSGYSEVVFEGLDKEKYSAKWSVARAYNKIDGRLQDVKIELWNLTRDKQEQGTKTVLLNKIEKLIGLKFQQFTRTVLLAQGDFATFLKAKQEEKAALLEKLTGTQIYSEISSKVFDYNKQALEEYNNIKKNIDSVNLIPAEELQALKDELKSVENGQSKLNVLHDEYKALNQKTASLEMDYTSKTKNLKATESQVEASKSSLEDINKKYAEAEQQAEQLESQTAALTESLKEARKLDQIVSAQKEQLKNIFELRDNAEKKKRLNENNTAEAEKDIQESEKKKNEIKSFFDKYENKRQTVEQYTALRLKLDRAKEIKDKLRKIDKSVSDAEKKLASLEKSVLDTSKLIAANNEALSKKEKEFARTEEEKSKINVAKIDDEIVRLENIRNQKLVEQAENVEKLRNALKDGVPCPVCGSLTHPYSDSSLLMTVDDVNKLTNQITALKKEKASFTEKSNKMISIQQEISSIKDNLSKQMSDAESKQTDMRNTALSIEKERAERKEEQSALDKVIGDISGMFGNNAWQKNWEDDDAAFDKSLKKFADKWKENELSLIDTDKNLLSLNVKLNNLRGEKPELEQVYIRYNNLYNEQNESLDKYEKQRKLMFDGKDADAVESEHNEKVKAMKQTISNLSKTKDKLMADSAKLEGSVQTLKADVATLSGQLAAAKEERLRWNERFAVEYGENSIDSLIKDFANKHTKLTFDIKTQEENSKKVESMKADLEKAFDKKEEWGKLNELIGSRDGSKFKQAVQVYTLEYLVEHANKQLKRLNPRYGLQCVPGKLALEIIDHDMCDEIRSVHTLSGGESFLVSLALAIGLATLSSNQMNVESLFIDEGFGSLDAETLRVAMDALENLRTEGRKIGVISHVQEMTERISVQVRVTRAGNGRSVVETVSI